MFMWMSSSSARNTKRPVSISAAMRARPRAIFRASVAVTIPCFASIATWAREPWMSSRQSRLSTSIEALIAVMTAAGPAA
jgi:hypothetical protein